jgi:predicted deacylase
MSRTSTAPYTVLFGAVFCAAVLGVYMYLSRVPAVVIEEKPVVLAPTSPIHSILGKSVQSRDIDAYTFASPPAATIDPFPGTSAPQKHIIFVGGIHGGYEWNSVELANNALVHLKKNPHLVQKNTSVTIIPNLNPDGFAKSKSEDGRFNAHNVDLNRNFACKWQPTSTWKGKKVSGGTKEFSEPESAALRDYLTGLLKLYKPEDLSFVFWHSQAKAVYASACGDKPLSATLDLMRTYATAADYKAVASFDAYPVTGAAEDWLASLGIAAITVELSTHTDIQWEKNKKGAEAVLRAQH